MVFRYKGMVLMAEESPRPGLPYRAPVVLLQVRKILPALAVKGAAWISRHIVTSAPAFAELERA